MFSQRLFRKNTLHTTFTRSCTALTVDMDVKWILFCQGNRALTLVLGCIHLHIKTHTPTFERYRFSLCLPGDSAAVENKVGSGRLSKAQIGIASPQHEITLGMHSASQVDDI